jgi:hypothetical protein
MIDQELLRDMETVKFGIEVESFLAGPVGRYLTAKAHAEIDEAVEELKRVDATDTSLVQHIQNRIWRAESLDSWLAQAIREGWNAEEHLRNQEG